MAEVVFVGFLHCKVALSFQYYALWKQVTMWGSYLWRGELHSTFLRIDYILKLFGIFLHERFVPDCLPASLPSFLPSIFLIYLCQYELMDIYTLGDNTVLLYFLSLLKLFWLEPLGALLFGSCFPLTFFHQCTMHNALSPCIFLALVLKSAFTPRIPDSVCLCINIWVLYLFH